MLPKTKQNKKKQTTITTKNNPRALGKQRWIYTPQAYLDF